MVIPWYMDQGLQSPDTQNPLSKDSLLKLRRFFMRQLALSEALLEAKPLGICKITTSVGEASLDTFHEVDESPSSILSEDVVLKEMSS